LRHRKNHASLGEWKENMKINAKINSGTGPKRIFILDDHPMTREGLSGLLGRETGLSICGAAGTVAQAHELVNSLKPDLVITDISLPDKSGMEFVREMKRFHPGVPVLVVSMHDEMIYAERLLQAGAVGYVMKSEDGGKLVEAVRRVLGGEIYVSRKLSESVLIRSVNRRAQQPQTPIAGLTEREFDVFQLIGQGLDTKAIAKQLHISGKTVETHRGNLRRKLKQETSTKLASYAVRWASAKQLI
jgi:DNA-binding NarL/FixJ family response regulator